MSKYRQEVMDELKKHLGTEAKAEKALGAMPIWSFSWEALVEISEFMDTITDEEYIEMKIKVKSPLLVMTRLNFKPDDKIVPYDVLVFDVRKTSGKNENFFPCFRIKKIFLLPHLKTLVPWL